MTDSYGFSYNAEMIAFASANLEYWQHLIKPIKSQKELLFNEQDPIFRPDIEKQYIDRVKHVLLCDICYRLGLPADYVLIFIESLNIKGL